MTSSISSQENTKKWNPYPSYKDSGVEWLGNIPAHWIVDKYAHLFRSAMGPTILREDLNDDGDIPVYSATESGAIFGRISRPHIELIPGDMVIPARGVSIGYVLLVRERSTCTQTTIYSKLADSTRVCPDYVQYFLVGHRDVLFYYDRTAIPQITVDQVNSNPLLLPPIYEQRIIASFLDRETAKIDTLIKKKERLIELLQEKRTALISRAVTKGLDPNVPMKDSGVEWLGKIPAHWKLKRLKHVAPIRTNKLESKPDDAIYVGLEHIESWTGWLILDRQPEKVDSVVDSFKAGDVLFGKLRPYLAKAARPNFDGVCTSEILAIRPGASCSQSYLMYCLLNTHYIRWLDSMTYGTKMPRVSPEQVRTSFIPMPPLSGQHAIADFLDRETAKIYALIKKIQEAILKLKEYRTALVSAAVTGKIDVREEVE